MMRKQTTGNDRIHAFVDGQLEGLDRARFLADLEKDANLRDQVSELQRMKEYVVHAFEDVPSPARRHTTGIRRFDWIGAGIAATVLLGVGFTAGRVTLPTADFPVNTISVSAPVQQDAQRMIIHVSESDPINFTDTLDRAERLLHEYEQRGIRVEVIANAGGVDLLRADVSTHLDRVQAMAASYDNLRFVACSNTMDRLNRQGIEAPLVPGTYVAPSAVEHIVERLQDGWTYIRV